jgi:hypothetical protein
MNPSAQRRSNARVFGKSKLAKSFSERGILRIRGDCGDGVYASVVRGGPEPSSVTSKLVTAPPTNTNSPSTGRRSAAVAIRYSRFERGMGLL